MNFNEKLQQLRKQNNMTQEELAKVLFVSRTAVSKWESGKGYPNIDSLKSIAEVFGITIDDLLSNNELITLAINENDSNINKISTLAFGLLDILVIIFIFLPLYAKQEPTYVHTVSLLSNPDLNTVTFYLYFAFLFILSVLGIIEIFLQFKKEEKKSNTVKLISIAVHTVTILLFIASRQPYAAALMFILFGIKIILLFNSKKYNKRSI